MSINLLRLLETEPATEEIKTLTEKTMMYMAFAETLVRECEILDLAEADEFIQEHLKVFNKFLDLYLDKDLLNKVLEENQQYATLLATFVAFKDVANKVVQKDA